MAADGLQGNLLAGVVGSIPVAATLFQRIQGHSGNEMTKKIDPMMFFLGVAIIRMSRKEGLSNAVLF